jgi:hypothetical protein
MDFFVIAKSLEWGSKRFRMSCGFDPASGDASTRRDKLALLG